MAVSVTALPAARVCERAGRLVAEAGWVVSFRPSNDGRWPIIATARDGDDTYELGRFDPEPLADDSVENQAAMLANVAIALCEERHDAV
jgi:hypothetical protein